LLRTNFVKTIFIQKNSRYVILQAIYNMLLYDSIHFDAGGFLLQGDWLK